jgi:hypothetical protein
MSVAEPGPMPHGADHYRQLATQCREIADRMSLKSDKARMLEMAQQWSEMAKAAERSESGGG